MQLVNMIAIVTVKPVSRFMNIDTFHCINTERILFHDHISSGTGQSNILLIVISHYTGPINTIWHWPDRQHRDNFRQDNATTTSSYERRCRYHRQTGQYCQAYVVTLFLSRKYLSYLTIVHRASLTNWYLLSKLISYMFTLFIGLVICLKTCFHVQNVCKYYGIRYRNYKW